MTIVAVTGPNVVTSLSNLRDSVATFLSNNGWSSAGKNVTKGNLAFRLEAVGSANGEQLEIQGSINGVQSPGISYLLAGNMLNGAITWPAQYSIAVYKDPDLVVVSINHDSIYWQHAIFGYAISLGLPGDGNGIPFHWSNWHSVSSPNMLVNNADDAFTQDYKYRANECFPFQHIYSVSNQAAFHSGFAYLNAPIGYGKQNNYPAFKWYPDTPPDGVEYTKLSASGDFPEGSLTILHLQPNKSNGDNVFVPLRAAITRPDGFFSWAFEIPHIRLARNDYYPDAQLLTKGSDHWLIYPCRRKNASQRWNQDDMTDHSGTVAFAVPTLST